MFELFKKFLLGDEARLFNQGVVASLFFALAFSALSMSPAGEGIRDMSRKVDFLVREKSNRSPEINSKLKFVVFDNQSVGSLGYPDLKLSDWTYLIHGIAKTRPGQLIIAKQFDYILRPTFTRKFNRQMSKYKFPIYSGGYVASQDIAPNEVFQLKGKSYDLERHTNQLSDAKWMRITPKMAFYGPHSGLATAFSSTGHMNIDQYGNIEPILRLSEVNFVPHIGLTVAKTRHIESSGLYLDNKKVPLDDRNKIIPNLLTQSAIASKSISLSEILRQAKAREKIDFLEKNDVVMILPSLSFGSIERKSTPVGELPADYIHASVVNSALNGEWVTPMRFEVILILAMSVVGMALGLWISFSATLWAIGAFSFLFIAGSVGIFANYSVSIPWILPSLCAFSNGLYIFTRRTLIVEKESDFLKRNLQGRVSKERLVALLSNRSALKFEASEQVLTIMFIDIVGFSRTANKQTPTEAFSALKSILSEIRTLVHEFGGEVDRTMGDAMLCVFGYNLTKEDENFNHADQALKCADAIQNANIRRIITRQVREVVFPLRIGINTTNAYIGNLGDTKSLDLTVIGDGVNFAQRLESACDRHMVLVGPATKDYLRYFPQKDSRLTQKLIRIKHQEELGVAFEFDPFANDPDAYRQAESDYRESIGAERTEVRWPLAKGASLIIHTNHGDGNVVNFSVNGMAVTLDTYLSNGVTITIQPNTNDVELAEFLKEHGLSGIVAVVKWARPAGDRFIHGLMYKNIGISTREKVLDLFRSTLSVSAKKDSA